MSPLTLKMRELTQAQAHADKLDNNFGYETEEEPREADAPPAPCEEEIAPLKSWAVCALPNPWGRL